MNRLIITFLFFFSAMTIYSQELSVKSFSEKISDLSASTHLREDNNGEPCALIKVQMPISGATFEPNVIGDVEYKTNEYWVYLPTISKKLRINHPKYQTSEIVFSDYGVSELQPKMTYVLVISDEFDVVIRSIPERAEIILDGKHVAHGQYNGEIKSGTHKVQLKWHGYKTRKEDIYVNNGSQEFEFELDPKAPKARVINNVGNAYYISPTYQFVAPSSAGLVAGVYNGGVNFELSVLCGLKGYRIAGTDLAGPFEVDYGWVSVGAKIGYGFRMSGLFRIAPQIGYILNASGSGDIDDVDLEKTSFRQMAIAQSVSTSARLEFIPVRWLGISVTPEYIFRVHDGDRFKLLKNYSDEIDKIGKGFRLNLSLNIYIPYGNKD